jgi:hypothetical protein
MPWAFPFNSQISIGKGCLFQRRYFHKNRSVRSSFFGLESRFESKDLPSGEEIKKDEETSPKDRPPKGWISLSKGGADQSVPIDKP